MVSIANCTEIILTKELHWGYRRRNRNCNGRKKLHKGCLITTLYQDVKQILRYCSCCSAMDTLATKPFNASPLVCCQTLHNGDVKNLSFRSLRLTAIETRLHLLHFRFMLRKTA